MLDQKCGTGLTGYVYFSIEEAETKKAVSVSHMQNIENEFKVSVHLIYSLP